MRIGIVAGESSGDQLGAALIEALRAEHPQAQFFGVGGPKMQAQGCTLWAGAEELAVMGLAEVLHHLPRLLKLRRALIARFTAAQPDVFVGIDSPEFNLGLAARLKRRGLKTVQYVSPQVWAWRQGRVKTIGQACDLVLCLLPFETKFYAEHQVRAVFVGHPLADRIPLEVDQLAARRALSISADAKVIALLPGSRMGEVQRLGADFIAAAQWMAARENFQFIAPMASGQTEALFAAQLAAARASHSPGSAPADIRILHGQSHTALAAADGALVASGTATLETLLFKRPMVVAYRLSAATAFLVRALGLLKVPYFSQPNLLIGRALVPEFSQRKITPHALGAALLTQLADPRHLDELRREFRCVHETLRQGGAARAASAILELAGAPVCA